MRRLNTRGFDKSDITIVRESLPQGQIGQRLHRPPGACTCSSSLSYSKKPRGPALLRSLAWFSAASKMLKASFPFLCGSSTWVSRKGAAHRHLSRSGLQPHRKRCWSVPLVGVRARAVEHQTALNLLCAGTVELQYHS